jgi:hypothetical protein
MNTLTFSHDASSSSAAREGASTFLRRVLLVDAATSAAAGLAMLVGASPLEGVLGLSPALLRPAGAVLIAFAAFVFLVARRDTISRGAVWTIIGLNAVWALDSLLLLVSGAVSPSGLGTAFVILQALAVVVLAELEWLGLRRL